MLKRAFLRRVFGGAAAAACAFGTLPSAFAQDSYPGKPIRIIVSFAPGGLTDTIARALQAKLQEGFGQPIVIENRPGAGGTIAEATLARAPADGYTLLLSADSVPANPHLVPNLSYDSFKDLQPVSLLARIPLVMLVNNNVPANNLKEFVAYAKSNKGKVSYASPGIGTGAAGSCSPCSSSHCSSRVRSVSAPPRLSSSPGRAWRASADQAALLPSCCRLLMRSRRVPSASSTTLTAAIAPSL